MLVKELLPSAALTDGHLWQFALAVAVVAYLIKEIRSYRRLSHFPTPSWFAAVSGLWLFRTEVSGKNYVFWEAACEKYGNWSLTFAEQHV